MTKKIVLFGTDNSGKTTLGNKLADSIMADYLPPLGPAEMEKQLEFMNKHLCSTGSTIFDRFPIIEENVCGNIFRGKSNFDKFPSASYLKKVDVFIFCNPGLEAILDWGEREQMKGVKENIIRMYAAYSGWFKILKDKGYTVVEYNWKVPSDYEKVLEEVLR